MEEFHTFNDGHEVTGFSELERESSMHRSRSRRRRQFNAEPGLTSSLATPVANSYIFRLFHRYRNVDGNQIAFGHDTGMFFRRLEIPA